MINGLGCSKWFDIIDSEVDLKEFYTLLRIFDNGFGTCRSYARAATYSNQKSLILEIGCKELEQDATQESSQRRKKTT